MKQHESIYIITILTFLSYCILFSKSLNYIRIPFGLKNTNNVEINSDLINKMFKNIIYINLTIGTPAQIVPLILRIDSRIFYISSKTFNKTNSNTFNSTTDFEIYFDYEYVESGYYSTDFFHFNNNSTKIEFLLNGEKSELFGGIGLLIPTKTQFGFNKFFETLKKNNVTNSYTWTLKYFNNYSFIDYYNKSMPIGEFIFGEEPHNYEENKILYNESNYHSVSPIERDNILYWEFIFDSIYQNNNNNVTIIDELIHVEINPEINYIIGTKEYFDIIKLGFFLDYLKNDICREIKLQKQLFNYIECDADKEKFKFENFPNLCFEHKELSYTFILNSSDLFLFDDKNNKFIFLVFDRIYPKNYWSLGIPFLKKYQFVFNEESKTIGYYIPNHNIDQEIENGNNNKIFLYITFSIILLIVIILGVIFIKCIKKWVISLPRKKRANELDDDNFIYENSNKNTINNSINCNGKIINDD